ncbi:hypothetical protein HBI70_165060 [Parastagonospora nodorum]|nr:hypothetical protein HBH51_091180 [Parastagonospora nodorum]KAH4048783.1 hypothetical protein HBH49_151210 [Parastagonospora nodorum]KAH4104000.1 hypothetical protein HBH46_104430 [Parastagonospora nodorum]KAH4266155.1 hypothetical protein HBI03_075670 [Parastagonospora nodorum]KAH4275540.1 hypothetical protein HBI04_122850 [Parastagonospora nodorum]
MRLIYMSTLESYQKEGEDLTKHLQPAQNYPELLHPWKNSLLTKGAPTSGKLPLFRLG